MARFLAGAAAVLLRCAVVSGELSFHPEVHAADGWHTLTLEQTPFIDAAYGITTRGFRDAPTFRMKPGETLQVELMNNLDPANNIDCGTTMTEFCKASSTNFHTHGLHVSSKGSDELPYASDDVFATVAPGSSKRYEFSIPDYHMGGTHWYHPHLHHATSLQAGGGAAGALIVDDPPGYLPDVYTNMVEKILFISGHNLVTLQEIAQDAQSGVLEDAVAAAGDAGLDTNIFLVNGQLGENMTIGSHVWHRLRMVYAAVEQSLDLTVTGDATCTMQLLAKDGIYLHTIPRAITTVKLYPGARADVAMSCECTGVAYPCTAEVASAAGRRLQPPGGGGPGGPGGGGPGMAGDAPDEPGLDVAALTLLTITVTETSGGVVETLPTTTPTRPCYLADLQSATVPSGQSGDLAFNLAEMSVTWNGVGDSMNYANTQAAGGMTSWTALTSFTTGSVYEISANGVGNHPLHSHVNPYQIQDMNGETTMDDGYFQAGDWHDTLYIGSLGGGANVNVRVRMNTDSFTGKMVIHCHILSHEDQGMMGYISLDGTEGAVFADAKTLDSTCYDTAFVGDGVTPAPPPTPAPCADDDAHMMALATGVGVMISGCADVQSYCEDTTYGSTLQGTCPATCGLCTEPCADDDAQMMALATGAGVMISGCADVQSYCEDKTYGSILQGTCPATCGLCTEPCADDDDLIIALASDVGFTISGCADVQSYCGHADVQIACPATCGSCMVRRLAGGKDPNIDELDWTVPAAEVGQKTEEFGNPDTNLFYP